MPSIPATETPSAAAAPAPAARGFRTLARASELVAAPRLLEAYGRTFDGGDDATLVIIAAVDAPDAVDRLQMVVAELGLDGPAGPDMLVVLDDVAAAAGVHAVLSEVDPDPASHPPRFDASRTLDLRRLAERHWSGVDAAPAHHDFQAPRIEQLARLSTCRRVSGEPIRAQPVLLLGAGRIEFGRGVQFGWPQSPGFYSEYAYVEAAAESSVIEVGDDVLFNNTVTLRSEGPGISIGAECLFGTHVQVFDSDFHDLHPRRRRSGVPRTAEVRIGRNVFLGSNVMVMKGVTIGDDAVVGAASIVTESLPAATISAGNPARVVRALEER